MKKRFFIIISIVLCCIMLTGCNSSDYKKAVNLFENGDFELAILLFQDLGDYKDATSMLSESKYCYAKKLLENNDFDSAIRYFKEIGDYKGSYNLLNSKAQELVAKEQFSDALKILYFYDEKEDYIKDIYYQYLNWQFDNNEYKDTKVTYEKVKGYKDASTNEKFAGAKLIGKKLSFSNTEVSLYGGSTMFITLNFTDKKLKFNLSGGTISFYTYNLTNDVDIDKEWNYKFVGKDIYLKNDSGNFVKKGHIGTYKSAKGGKDATVILSIDPPDGMKITNTKFEISELYD